MISQCAFNPHVDCEKCNTSASKCHQCGWNPRVEAERREVARKKILRAIYHEPTRQVFIYPSINELAKSATR